MISRICFPVLFACFIMVAFANAQEPYHASIKGIVVDEKGRPIARAGVTFGSSATLRDKKCWVKDDSVATDAGGQFLHQEYCSISNRTVFLFTEATIGLENTTFPIFAPFWPKLRRNNPKFAGLLIELNGNSQIDLGKIPVQVWYNRVELFVSDIGNRPFYKTEDDWAKFVLIVRDEKGDAVGSTALSTQARQHNLRVDRGSVDLALPEGTWTLELLRNWDDIDTAGRTLRLLAKGTVVVNKTDRCLQARLVVK